jgi:hypothetical protein
MTYMSQSTGYGNSSFTAPVRPLPASYGLADAVEHVPVAYSGHISNLEAAVDTAVTAPYSGDSGIQHMIQNSSSGAAYGSLAASYANPSQDYSSPAPTQGHTEVIVNGFLKPSRPESPFIGKVADIQHYIEQAFEAVTGSTLPNDVTIEIVSTTELKKRHEVAGGSWSPGLQGFAQNKQGLGTSSIVVRENDLDKVMITIGHEIGHVLTLSLGNQHDEEAKAFAFEMAWINALVNHNIADLALSINPNPMPAMNGLHNVAFGFVKEKMQLGKEAIDVFRELSRGKLSMNMNTMNANAHYAM